MVHPRRLAGLHPTTLYGPSLTATGTLCKSPTHAPVCTLTTVHVKREGYSRVPRRYISPSEREGTGTTANRNLKNGHQHSRHPVLARRAPRPGEYVHVTLCTGCSSYAVCC